MLFFHWNRARIRCIVPLIIGMIQLGTVNLSGRNQSSAGEPAGRAGAERSGGHLARWART